MKLRTFSISRTKEIYAKTIVSEYIFKLKAMRLINIFRIFAYISSYLQTKTCKKARLCNIFEATNAKTLIKAILQGSTNAM